MGWNVLGLGLGLVIVIVGLRALGLAYGRFLLAAGRATGLVALGPWPDDVRGDEFGGLEPLVPARDANERG